MVHLKWTRLSFAFLVVAFSSGLIWNGQSCDLTIRQAGFLTNDLDAYQPLTYRLKYIFNSETADEKEYIQKVHAMIEKEMVGVNIEFDTFALESLPPRDQRAIREDKNNPKLPFTMLSYGIENAPWRIWKRRVTPEEIKKLAFSKTKVGLPAKLIENYCVLLFSPGTDEKATAKARAEVKKFISDKKLPVAQSVDGLEEDDDTLPEANTKYTMMEMSAKQIEAELPFAALVSNRKKRDLKQPWVGMVFGKGKMMDLVLVGDKCTADNLYGELGQLETSCSCSVDIQTFTTDLMMKWTDEQDERIIKEIAPADETDGMWAAPAETDEDGNLVEKGKDTPKEGSSGKVKTPVVVATKDTPPEKTTAAVPAAEGSATPEVEVAAVKVTNSEKVAAAPDTSKVTAPAASKAIAPAPVVAVISEDTQSNMIYTIGGVVALLLLVGGIMVASSRSKA